MTDVLFVTPGVERTAMTVLRNTLANQINLLPAGTPSFANLTQPTVAPAPGTLPFPVLVRGPSWNDVPYLYQQERVPVRAC